MFTTSAHTQPIRRSAERTNRTRPVDKTRTKKAKRQSKQRKGN